MNTAMCFVCIFCVSITWCYGPEFRGGRGRGGFRGGGRNRFQRGGFQGRGGFRGAGAGAGQGTSGDSSRGRGRGSPYDREPRFNERENQGPSTSTSNQEETWVQRVARARQTVELDISYCMASEGFTEWDHTMDDLYGYQCLIAQEYAAIAMSAAIQADQGFGNEPTQNNTMDFDKIFSQSSMLSSKK